MIIDTLDHADTYTSLHPYFAQAFAFLRDPALATLPLGKHKIDGDAIYANIQDYTARDIKDCRLEAHRRYIDIQFLLTGNEAIGYTPISDTLTETVPYSDKDDILFYAGTGTPIPFTPNGFFILFPQDAHAPGIETTLGTVRKIVIKIAL